MRVDLRRQRPRRGQLENGNSQGKDIGFEQVTGALLLQELSAQVPLVPLFLVRPLHAYEM